MLDLQRLRTLQEVALRGSFSAAASSLNFSTSAISQQMAQLEREVGVALVDRRSTGVALTAAGELLLRHANAILARVADATSELRTLVDGDEAKIRCGAFSSAAATLLPDVVSTFRKRLPHAVVTLVESDRCEILDGIRRDELDLGVVAYAGIDADPLGSEDIERIPLFVEAIDVIMSTGHPLADAPALALDDLAREAWAECDARPVRRFVTSNGSVPRIVFEGSRATMLRVVAEGDAICLLPRLGQRQLPPGVVARPIAPDPPSRRVEIAVRATDTRAPVRMFAGVLCEVATANRAAWAPHNGSPVGAN